MTINVLTGYNFRCAERHYSNHTDNDQTNSLLHSLHSATGQSTERDTAPQQDKVAYRLKQLHDRTQYRAGHNYAATGQSTERDTTPQQEYSTEYTTPQQVWNTTPQKDKVLSGTQLRNRSTVQSTQLCNRSTVQSTQLRNKCETQLLNWTKYRARHNSATGVQYRVHNSATGVKHSSSTGHLKYRARQQRILRKGVRRLLSFVSVHTNNRPNPNNVQATRCIKSDKV